MGHGFKPSSANCSGNAVCMVKKELVAILSCETALMRSYALGLPISVSIVHTVWIWPQLLLLGPSFNAGHQGMRLHGGSAQLLCLAAWHAACMGASQHVIMTVWMGCWGRDTVSSVDSGEATKRTCNHPSITRVGWPPHNKPASSSPCGPQSVRKDAELC